MGTAYTITNLSAAQLPAAVRLIREVFMVYEAPDYAAEGVEEFLAYIEPAALAEKLRSGELRFWAAREGAELLGVIAAYPGHISLLFVDGRHHRRGIARSLVETVIGHDQGLGQAELTVNSSPYAVEAYRHLGFAETAAEQTVNGIRFIPMRRAI